jgi:hypothetical protein
MEFDANIGEVLMSLEDEMMNLNNLLLETTDTAKAANLRKKINKKEKQIDVLRKYHASALRSLRSTSPLKAPVVNEKHLQAVSVLHSLQELH